MTRRAGGRSGGKLHKMHKNAHIKKSLSESHELREMQQNATQKNGEQRANKEESAILQHEHGRGLDAPGIS